MFECRSALASRLQPRSASGVGGPLTIGEGPGCALVQASAFVGTMGELERIVRGVLGAGLPQRVGATECSTDHRIFKVGPERFWIVGPQGAWIASLEQAVRAQIGSIVSLSHARTRLFIDGAASRAVLSRGIALDLHPEAFRLDAYALTGLEHTPVLLHRAAPNRYELYVPRTFAVWVWEWLTDAALPFGFEVAGTSSLGVGG